VDYVSLGKPVNVVDEKSETTMGSIKDFIMSKRLFPHPRSDIVCLECGHHFKRVIKATTVEIKCPRCGGYDTEIGIGEDIKLASRRQLIPIRRF
jgi:Zn finger protein HypA/HybF involved in hydrogenase expression